MIPLSHWERFGVRVSLVTVLSIFHRRNHGWSIKIGALPSEDGEFLDTTCHSFDTP